MSYKEDQNCPTVLAATYVYHYGTRYFVSTINRTCSALAAAGMIYAETIAWEWKEGDTIRGEIVQQGADVQDCLDEHMRIVIEIFDYGDPRFFGKVSPDEN